MGSTTRPVTSQRCLCICDKQFCSSTLNAKCLRPRGQICLYFYGHGKGRKASTEERAKIQQALPCTTGSSCSAWQRIRSTACFSQGPVRSDDYPKSLWSTDWGRNHTIVTSHRWTVCMDLPAVSIPITWKCMSKFGGVAQGVGKGRVGILGLPDFSNPVSHLRSLWEVCITLTGGCH